MGSVGGRPDDPAGRRAQRNLAVRAASVKWRTVLTAAAVLAGSVAIWLPVQALVRWIG